MNSTPLDTGREQRGFLLRTHNPLLVVAVPIISAIQHFFRRLEKTTM